MNKGLFAHIIATIIFILAVFFVIQDEATNMMMRFGICVLLFLFHFIIALVADSNEWYKKKL